MRAAVGGTFNVLHDGHKTLLDRAFDIADEVMIGITSDGMASEQRTRSVPFVLRKKAVEEYLSGKNVRFSVYEINDIYGPAADIAEIDAIVVSEETEKNAVLINQRRAEKGLDTLAIDVVRMKRFGGEIIRGRDVMSGACSRSGDRGAMRIAVGSVNPVKTEAVRTVAERIFKNVRIIPFDASSDVPEQPWNGDTCKGAVNRAVSCIGDNDLGIGIEAGVFEMYGGVYDIQHCAVIDKEGDVTIGMGPGFRYPDEVADLLRAGMSVGEAMLRLHGKDRGRGEGAVGYLSCGLIDRKTLTEQAVTAAMIPRMRSIRYERDV